MTTGNDANLDLFDVHGESPIPQSKQTPDLDNTNVDDQTDNASNDENIQLDNDQPQQTQSSPEPQSDQQSNKSNDEKSQSNDPISLPTTLIRSLSDKINPLLTKKNNNNASITPTVIQKAKSAFTLAISTNYDTNPNIFKNDTPKSTSSNTSSPQPPITTNNTKNINMTLNKFSKEDLFKLFGKARKQNRVLQQEINGFKSKNKDLYRALNASNEQNEVFQITNKHLRNEYNLLKTKSNTINIETNDKYKQLENELIINKKNNSEKILLLKTQSSSYIDEINRLNEQINQLKEENDSLQISNENVQSKIGKQYTDMSVEIHALKHSVKEFESEIDNLKNENDNLNEKLINSNLEIKEFREIIRKAETNIDRIESLEEELRDKIRDNHQLQITTRSQNSSIRKINEKYSKLNDKLKSFQLIINDKTSKFDILQKENITFKDNNKLLNEKLNILLKENAENTLKTEKQIQTIETFHLTKYKTLLKSFRFMKKQMTQINNLKNDINTNPNSTTSLYSNHGWKKYHNDNYSINIRDNNHHYTGNSNKKHLTYHIDLDNDDDDVNNDINDNISCLNQSINALSGSGSVSGSGSRDDISLISSNKNIRKYVQQIKEYKNIIYSLKSELKETKQNLEIISSANKKYDSKNKRLHKQFNIDYLRNVLVKFLILSEYLSDEQIVLVPVLGSILNLTKTEKDMIDNSYNNNRYFMGPNTLFPENANAKYSPNSHKKNKNKKKHHHKKKKDKKKVAKKSSTGDFY